MTDKDEEECLNIIRKENYYDILGIPKTAKAEEVRKAYKKLAIKFHPDKNKAKSAEEAFKKVSQAFSVLSDEQKRRNYDMFGKEDIGGGSGFNANVDPFDIFNMFFGEGFPMNNMGGNTTFKFSNGNGTFTMFSSGGQFPNMFTQGFRRRNNNDNFNPFDELFGFNGFRRQRNSESHTNRQNEDLQKSLKNLSICLNLFPVLCCLIIFFVIPALIRI